jgi:hypothetical protein
MHVGAWRRAHGAHARRAPPLVFRAPQIRVDSHCGHMGRAPVSDPGIEAALPRAGPLDPAGWRAVRVARRLEGGPPQPHAHTQVGMGLWRASARPGAAGECGGGLEAGRRWGGGKRHCSLRATRRSTSLRVVRRGGGGPGSGVAYATACERAP